MDGQAFNAIIENWVNPVSRMKFATAVNCMEGRTQLPVIAYLKKKFEVDYVDMVTEAGPVKILDLCNPQGSWLARSRSLRIAEIKPLWIQ